MFKTVKTLVFPTLFSHARLQLNMHALWLGFEVFSYFKVRLLYRAYSTSINSISVFQRDILLLLFLCI